MMEEKYSYKTEYRKDIWKKELLGYYIIRKKSY